MSSTAAVLAELGRFEGEVLELKEKDKREYMLLVARSLGSGEYESRYKA